MSAKKKIVYSAVLIVALSVSLLVGLFYNALLSRSNFFFNFYLQKFMYLVPILALYGVAVSYVVRYLGKNVRANEKTAKISISFVAALTLLGTMWVTRTPLFYISPPRGMGIGLLFALICFVINETARFRHGYAIIIAEVIITSVLVGLVCGLKLALGVVPLLCFISILSVSRKSTTKKTMCFSFVLIATALILVLITLALSTSLHDRIYGFLHQSGVVEYEAIKDVIMHAKLIDFNFNIDFVAKIKTGDGCMYIQFLNAFGWLPLIIHIALQISLIVIMGVFSSKVNGFYNTIMWACTATVAIQFAATVASSFGVIPIGEFGMNFVCPHTLCYNIIPMTVFLFLLFDKSAAADNQAEVARHGC